MSKELVKDDYDDLFVTIFVVITLFLSYRTMENEIEIRRKPVGKLDTQKLQRFSQPDAIPV